MRWMRGAGSAFLYAAFTALSVVLMLAGAYAGIVIAGNPAEPHYQSRMERRVRSPGDDPGWFAGAFVRHAVGGVIGFFTVGALLALAYGVWAARRERGSGS